MKLPTDVEARHMAMFRDRFAFCFVNHHTGRARSQLEFVSFLANIVTTPPGRNTHDKIIELVSYVSEHSLFALPPFYSP